MRREGRMKTLVISCYLYAATSVILSCVGFVIGSYRVLGTTCITIALTLLTFVLASCYAEDGLEITKLLSLISFLAILPILLPSSIMIYGYNIFVRTFFNTKGGDDDDEY